MNNRDLVIIGGGAGGLVVASVASQLGLKVTLIEKEDKLGGDCLHYGCIPSKTLIHAAKVASLMRRGNEFGLQSVEPVVDLGKVNDHVQEVIDKIQPHDDPERFRAYGCEVLFGHARFISAHEVQVNDETVRGRRFVIATGSRPFIPPIPGLEQAGYLTNLELFSLRELPKRLVVLGGGPIGLEMGQAFARLGSSVTILQRPSQLLAKDDRELAAVLQDKLTKEGIAVHTSTQATEVHKDGDTKIVKCNRDLEIETDEILVAVGRSPNTQGLGLETIDIQHNKQGILVDQRLRTTQKHIYACGDVCGPYPFTHMAEYQAGIVISNTVFRFPKKVDYHIVPRVTFTDPELAQVGLTEDEARAQGKTPTVLRFDFKDNDRALTENSNTGLIKVIAYKNRILGASILGPHAGELIHEFALAMKMRAKLGDISATIHAYPTLSQINRRAINSFYAPKLFSPRTRKIVRFINKVLN